MKIDEIKRLSLSEMHVKLRNFRKKVLFFCLNKKVGDKENFVKIRILKKDISRLLTVINQKLDYV
ncbi:MAG: 50S ribosomal protein L29 [Rickettsiaceae bacterium H1]|nr:50S ribosomal protein L29 [Rickettsiaceae bacterium H1]